MLVLLTSACQPKPEDLIETLELVGCRDLRKGPICEIDGPTKLVIWVKVKEGAQLSIKTDHGPSPVKFHPYEDGYRTRFIATATAGAVIIEARRKGIDSRRWPLELHEKSELMKEAERLQSEGKEAEAKEKWEVLKESKEPREAAEALKQLGAAHGRRGEIDEAREKWGRAVEVAKGAGLVARAVNEQLSIAQTAVDGDRDLKMADRILNEVEAVQLPEDTLGAIHHRYYRAALAMRTGDLRSAQTAIRSVRAVTSRVERAKTDWAAALLEGRILGDQGRYQEQRRILEGLRNHDMTLRHPCNEATVLRGLTWLSIVDDERTEAALARAIETGRAAQDLFRRSCPDRDQAGNSAINLGLLLLLAGDLPAAETQLREARQLGAEATLERRLWLRELEAGLALARGQPGQALERYDTMAQEAGGTSPSAVWRTLVGRASALTPLGRKEEARAAYRSAAAVLRDESVALALDGGRASFLSSRRRATWAEIRLLFSEGRAQDAMNVAREARAQRHDVLVTTARLEALPPEDRARWAAVVEEYRLATRNMESALDASWGAASERLPRTAEAQATALRTRRGLLENALTIVRPGRAKASGVLPPDRLVLLYSAESARRYLACAQTRSAARCSWVELAPEDFTPPGLGRALLEPFSEELSGTQHVELLLDGPLAAKDLHAAPWRGQALIATHLVSYAVDGGLEAGAAVSGNALIAVDPREDLPEARDEGRWLNDRLKASGPVLLLSGASATRSALLAALSQTSHLHYAGHSVTDSTGGLESALLLAGAQSLTAGELLTLPRAPATVVLSSCEGTGPGEGTAPQVALAEAFALAGASWIVGPSRPVPDRLARRFVEALYRTPTAPIDRAYQAAVASLAEEASTEDWQSFRIVTP
ncbi:MAG: CHAT domain-containing protein [Deltaproteobacteria bacterium]|nr:CHAT domain-containing protein [Deltaproteobacteria bacterium]